ncbi:MAG: hypothetical protein P8Z41_10220 [Anaerolineales bacterium]
MPETMPTRPLPMLHCGERLKPVSVARACKPVHEEHDQQADAHVHEAQYAGLVEFEIRIVKDGRSQQGHQEHNHEDAYNRNEE